jgi:MYXO-CTERM domain-containing protein
MNRALKITLLLSLLLPAGPAAAQTKVFLNPSNQTWNLVAGGGNEAQYALIVSKLSKTTLTKAGFSATVDQDFKNAPKNANSWGADIFVSFHTNAGGGHGTETLYKSSGGKALADKVQKGLLAQLAYGDRGLKYRDNLHVLNSTNMYACLLEAVFHDCAKTSGYAGHPPSESAFLKTSSGQQKIADGVSNGVCAYFGKSCKTVSTTPQSGTLRGVVYRGTDLLDRIPGAKVKLSSGASTTASSTGHWSFTLTPGSYKVTASATGYTVASRSATVTAGAETWASIGLEREQSADAGVSLPDAQPTPDLEVDGGGFRYGRLLDGGLNGYDEDDDDDGPRGSDGCNLAGETDASLGWTLLLGLALVVLRRRRGR